MNPPRIEAVLLRWPDRVAFSAVGLLTLPGSPAVQLLWVGETPWKALAGMFAQAKGLSVVTAARWN